MVHLRVLWIILTIGGATTDHHGDKHVILWEFVTIDLILHAYVLMSPSISICISKFFHMSLQLWCFEGANLGPRWGRSCFFIDLKISCCVGVLLISYVLISFDACWGRRQWHQFVYFHALKDWSWRPWRMWSGFETTARSRTMRRTRWHCRDNAPSWREHMTSHPPPPNHTPIPRGGVVLRENTSSGSNTEFNIGGRLVVVAMAMVTAMVHRNSTNGGIQSAMARGANACITGHLLLASSLWSGSQGQWRWRWRSQRHWGK